MNTPTDLSVLAERLQGELHLAIWEAGKTAKPLKGYPVPKAELAAFNYGKDCATADIEQAVLKLLRSQENSSGR